MVTYKEVSPYNGILGHFNSSINKDSGNANDLLDEREACEKMFDSEKWRDTEAKVGNVSPLYNSFIKYFFAF